MTTLLDISDDAIYTALSALIAVIVPGSTPINRGQQNRIPMPAEDCVYITTIGAPARTPIKLSSMNRRVRQW